MTPTATELLRLLGRPVLDPAKTSEIRALSAQLDDASWESFALRACLTTTAAWVAHNLQTLDIAIPAQAATYLRRTVRELVQRTLAAEMVLPALDPILTADRAPAMLIKGAVVEARAYPPSVVRPQLDVDILTAPGQFDPVVQQLLGVGFTTAWRTRSGHEIGLKDPDGTAIVEVHRTLVCPFRFAPFAERGVSDAIFAAAQRDALGRWTPGDVEHTTFLLLHLVELLYSDQRHVADVAAWLRAVAVSPEAVWACAQRWQATRAVAAGVDAVAAFDPRAVGPRWRALTATVADGAQARLADVARLWAVAHQRRTQKRHPRWLEGVGLAMHLDRPVRFFATYLPGRGARNAVGWDT